MCIIGVCMMYYLGQAHFCEHMLFMGTEKYPEEQEYMEYVQKNGGNTNAFTAAMHTVYYATVKPEAIDGLVERTAEFFISPNFNASAVDREVEAVNSEFLGYLQNDDWRSYRCSCIHMRHIYIYPFHI